MSVLVALIHNNNPGRLKSARNTANYIIAEVNKLSGVSVDYIEVFAQGKKPKVSNRFWRRVRSMSNQTQYRYLRYHIEASISKWLPFLFAWCVDLLKVPGSRELTKLAIEHAVTRKHLQALEAGSNHDITIVIEDDAVIESGGEDTGPTLRSLFKQILLNPKNLIYVDFAGGFDLTEVSPVSAKGEQSSSYVSSDKLFTNTACGYAMSSGLSELVLAKVGEDDRQSWLGVDFLFNRVFSLSASSVTTKCFHLTESAVSHGSMMGSFISWEKSLN